jgi:peptide/nickel transport system ATP-binding protein
MSAVTVTDLTVDFGRGRSKVRAVRGVSFELHPGEILALVGESGSGKSTIARVIAGLTPASSGKVRRTSTQRRATQLVFQDPMSSLNPRMSVRAMLAEALAAGPGGSSVEELAEKVSVDLALLDRYPHQLSGGQRQRVALGRALAVRPDVLVLDEFTASLDVTTQATLLARLLELRDSDQFACLFITHDLGVVAQVADRVIVLQGGRAVEEAPVRDLLERPQAPYTRSLLSAIPGVLAE